MRGSRQLQQVFECREPRRDPLVGQGNRLVQVRTRVINQPSGHRHLPRRTRWARATEPAGQLWVLTLLPLVELILVQNSFAAISTKRILTIVIPGKIMA